MIMKHDAGKRYANTVITFRRWIVGREEGGRKKDNKAVIFENPKNVSTWRWLLLIAMITTLLESNRYAKFIQQEHGSLLHPFKIISNLLFVHIKCYRSVGNKNQVIFEEI